MVVIAVNEHFKSALFISDPQPSSVATRVVEKLDAKQVNPVGGDASAPCKCIHVDHREWRTSCDYAGTDCLIWLACHCS